ncbi:MAG: hypothetical protein JW870_08425, partial [Candidatus Delongbacteria bacterium]|nr:hypothetical protein [Candidatus Delongbacteria bacterium]
TVTSKPKKKDSDMIIDKTKYKNRKERIIGMTADHTSQPDKVLFFADPHFLFFANPQMAHLQNRTSQLINPVLQKSHFFHHSINLT